jgi:hypothetical protein
MWYNWNDRKPEPAQKIAYLYGDGSGGGAGLAVDKDGTGDICILDAEDGFELMESVTKDMLWTPAPDNYAIMFMELDDRP